VFDHKETGMESKLFIEKGQGSVFTKV